MTELTHNQLVAREVFKSAVIHGDGAGYPERVTILPAETVSDLERFSDVLNATVAEGESLILVRADGAEMLIEPHIRRGIGGLVDRVLRRVRIDVSTRGDEKPVHHRYVHPQQVSDLKSLRGELAIC
ncbi:MAG TPA: hypothetical protein VNZ62_10790 [Capillimicrobium sp.]|jgi:hypothetical protein|nr:hypothetical protein [Capillimicrobium sp.]